MSELKPLPCPFCGHTGLSFEEGSTFRWGVASCDGCDATCGEIRRNYPDDGKWHAAAIEAWNRRAQPAITSETGNQAAQGASAITSESVPLLSNDTLLAMWSGNDERFMRPVLGRNKVLAYGRAIESLVRSKLGAGAGWIACEDQMPEPGTECLVRVKALSPTQSGPTHYTHIDTWDEQHEAPVPWSSATIPVGLGWGSFDFEDVTHWQPLPPPPGIVGKEYPK